MGRLFTRAIVATLSAALMLPANAQQQGSTITLSCNGTSKFMATSAADLKPDPIANLGIIVNLVNNTVSVMTYVAPINALSPTLVSFSGQQKVAGGSFEIDGTIDRVTGRTDIEWLYTNVGNNSTWELTCRPATRLF